MINCHINLQSTLSYAGERFCIIKLSSFDEIIPSIQKKIDDLILIQQEAFPEINIEVQFESQAEIEGIKQQNQDILPQFIISQKKILLRFFFEAPQSLKTQKLSGIQHKCDEAFLQALKNNLSTPKTETLISLNDLFLQRLPLPGLNKTIQIEENQLPGVRPSASPKDLPLLRPISLPDIGPRELNYADHPNFRHVKEILRCIPQKMSSRIVGILGPEGLRGFCQQCLVFTPLQFSELYNRFFASAEQEQQLFSLFLPSGGAYLKSINAWPKALIQHWVAWLGQDKNPNLSFVDAVVHMERFWGSIRDSYPKIAEPGLASQYDFVARLEEMQKLIDRVRPEYKKLQTEFLFKLKWRGLAQYESLFHDTQCQWICEEMFNEESQATPYTIHEKLKESCESQFYQYASQHMQDDSSAHLLFGYAEFIKKANSPDKTFAWQWAAWCSSLPKPPKHDEFKRIYEMLQGLESVRTSHFIEILFRFPLAKRPQYAVMDALIHVARGDGERFVKSLYFYQVWHDKIAKNYLESWQDISAFFNASVDILKVDRVLSLAPKEDLDSEQLYYQTLVFLLMENNEENLNVASRLANAFGDYPSQIKQSLIAILATYEPKAQGLSLPGLDGAIQAILDGDELEGSFLEHLPDSSFKYFKSVIDYQLVLNKMGALLSSVKNGLDFFLGDQRLMMFVPPVKTFLLVEPKEELEDKRNLVEKIQTELSRLKTLKTGIDVSHLFELFKNFDTFLIGFMDRSLGQTFHKSLFSLLPRLDKKLDRETKVSCLLSVLHENYAYLQKTSIGEVLPKDMLKILSETSNQTPLMQRLLKKYLVDELIIELEGKLESSLSADSLVTLEDRKKIASFLGELPLESEALNDFFIRYQAIDRVAKQWPILEQDLVRITPRQTIPLVYKALVDEHLDGGSIYASAHWHLALRLLKECIDSKIVLSSLPHFCGAFFKAKKGIKQIRVTSRGELQHEHLEKLFQSIFTAISKFGQNPFFLQLLPQAIDFVLSYGSDYDFEKNLDSFTKLGGNAQLLGRLMPFSHQPPYQHAVQDIMATFSKALAKENKTASPWRDAFVRILSLDDLEPHLLTINSLLLWLLEQEKFPWLQIILDDKDASVASLLALKTTLCGDGLWAKAYQELYLDGLKSEIIAPAQPKQGFWKKAWGYLAGAKTSAPNNVQSREDLEKRTAIDSSWTLWQKPPYPRLRQMQTWMGEASLEIQQRLQDFDRYPFGDLQPYSIVESDMSRWTQELEFYDYCAPEKLKIKMRLEKLMLASNELFSKKRTELKKQFYSLRDKYQTLTLDEQDSLLAHIVALYYKTTQKQPYPTQLLSLLVNLEYQNKNLVLEVDTGEGKGHTTALLAVLKWSLRKQATIEIRTANQDLVRQDYFEKGHWRLFQFLDIPSGIIQETTCSEAYKPGGIYYTTQQDIMVFKELYRLHHRFKALPEDIDVIVDEIDHVILDQISMINLSKKEKHARDCTWFYRAINEFIDQNMLDRRKPRYSLKQWAIGLKQALVDKFQNNQQYLAFINQFSLQKWQDWVEIGVYVKYLKENEHYIIEAIEENNSRYYQVVPYVNHEIKYGYDLSYKLKSGLKQLLHARLNSKERVFKLEFEEELITQVAPIDFRGIHSFVGLSGSIGSLSECYELKESLQAYAIRVSRYSPSQLIEFPLSLSENQASLYKSLKLNIQEQSNPILICLPEIEDAKACYDFLMGTFPSRPICLLTGQESQAVRNSWLHRKVNSQAVYAGSPNSITVATLICGRGTDIKVDSPYFLSILQVGVLEPRNMVQLKGRTARNNQCGTYQGYLNQQQILPGVESIQQHKMSLHRKVRLQFRLKAWLSLALFEQLNQILEKYKVNAELRHPYFWDVSQQLEELPGIMDLDVEACILPAVAILTTILSKLKVAGLVDGDKLETTLSYCLKANQERWVSMVDSPMGSSELAPSQAPELCSFLEYDFEVFRRDLESKIPLKEEMGWLSWFYDNDELTQHTTKILEDGWQEFKRHPNLENWTNFYQSLQTARAHLKAQEERFGWLKWIKYKSYLNPWMRVANHVDFIVQQNKILKNKQPFFYLKLKSEFERRLDSFGLAQGFMAFIKSIFYYLFSLFSSKTVKLVTDIKKLYDVFKRTNTEENLIKLWGALYELSELYQNSKSWSSWSVGHWLYWNNYCKPYLDLYAELPGYIANHNQLCSSIQLWQKQQLELAGLQLMFRKQLTLQIESYKPDLQKHGFWSQSQTELVKQKIEYEKVLKDKVVPIKIRTRLELDELVRAYPKEIQMLYAQYQRIGLDEQEQEKTLRWMLLAIFQAQFKPLSFKFGVDIESNRLKALCAELQRWSNCRELLIEWDRMNPSLS